MNSKSERIQVLEMIENRLITPEEGARLLKALDDPSFPGETEDFFTAEDEPVEAFIPESAAAPGIVVEESEPSEREGSPVLDFDPNVGRWRRWWLIPLWTGIAITVVGGLLMFLAFQASGVSFWFGCAWLPFLLGVFIMALAWSSRTSRWLHLRVHQKPGEWPQTISLSFPLPLRITAWFLRTFGQFIPQLKHTGVDELILALGTNTSPENPFFVEVDEGEDGERVQIYIG